MLVFVPEVMKHAEIGISKHADIHNTQMTHRHAYTHKPGMHSPPLLTNRHKPNNPFLDFGHLLILISFHHAFDFRLDLVSRTWKPKFESNFAHCDKFYLEK